MVAGWTAYLCRHAWPAFVFLTATTVLAGAYVATNLGINTDLDSMFAADLPYRVHERAYKKQFPFDNASLLIVVEADTPEDAGDAAEDLAQRLGGMKDLFASVYLPRPAFFDEHALLYMDTDELDELADRLARVQPYLAALAEDGTLRGLAMMLERGLAAVQDGEVSGVELEPMLDRMSQAIHAWQVGERFRVSWAEIVAGRDLGEEERRRFLIAQPVIDRAQLIPGMQAMDAIRRTAVELDLTPDKGTRVRITGDIALSYEEMSLVSTQAAQAGVASLVLVTVLLFACFRSARLVLAIVVTLLVGLVWTAGFAAAVVGHLNVISVAFTVLFLGLCVDFCIHIVLRYQELLSDTCSHPEALDQSVREVGTSVVLCALTTTIGFYAFLPTDFTGVAELGLISGTGILIGAVACFTCLPVLLSIGTPLSAPAAVDRSPAPETAPVALPVRHPRRVAVAAALLVCVAATALPSIRFDRSPLRVRDPRAESVQVFEEVILQASVSPWDLSVLTADLTAARALATQLQALPEVENAITVEDFVPEDQDDKLAIIEDVALFMAPLPGADDIATTPTVEQQLQALRGLRRELGQMLRGQPDLPLNNTATVLSENLDELLARAQDPEEAAAAVVALEASLLASLGDRLQLLHKSIAVGDVALDDLPRGLVRRMITPEGLARIRVSASADLNDDRELVRFVEAVRAVAPSATGSAVSIYEHSTTAIRAFRQALAAAVVVIAVMLFFLWRTLGETLLVMLPLTLASVFTAAVAVVAGIPFNYADIIVLPLLLGIGVDSGIHLVHRARMIGGDTTALLASSTARAIVFSSITTVASFGTLAFAWHRGIANIGQLLTIGVSLALVCNLFFLPAFLELRRRRRESTG